MSIKKSDIAKQISLEISINNSLSTDFLNSFINIIKSRISSSKVKIANFGTYTSAISPKRLGRNPKTGEEYIIPKRKKLKFIVSKNVKEKLN